jgi:hypothetical protein
MIPRFRSKPLLQFSLRSWERIAEIAGLTDKASAPRRQMYREGILLRAWMPAKANQGAPGVDAESFQA